MTPEEQAAAQVQIDAAKAAQEKLKKRIEELNALKGKIFVRNADGVKVTVMGYDGIKQRQPTPDKPPQQEHSLIVEGNGFRYCPPAHEFLKTHTPIEQAQPATPEII